MDMKVADNISELVLVTQYIVSVISLVTLLR